MLIRIDALETLVSKVASGQAAKLHEWYLSYEESEGINVTVKYSGKVIIKIKNSIVQYADFSKEATVCALEVLQGSYDFSLPVSLITDAEAYKLLGYGVYSRPIEVYSSLPSLAGCYVINKTNGEGKDWLVYRVVGDSCETVITYENKSVEEFRCELSSFKETKIALPERTSFKETNTVLPERTSFKETNTVLPEQTSFKDCIDSLRALQVSFSATKLAEVIERLERIGKEKGL